MMGEVIRLERLKRHWSREELGQKVQWSVHKIAHLESGRTELKVSDLHMFATVFGTTPAALLEEENQFEGLATC